MSELIIHDMSEYPQVLRKIFQVGEKRSPRGVLTLDAGFRTIVILNPSWGMPLGIGRNLNSAIGAMEAIQLIAGWSSTDLVLRVAPQFERYANVDDLDGDLYFHGAYGERIKAQAENVVRKLHSDSNTRQAVITLWDPWLDNLPDKRDYPCTIALQFYMQNGTLCMNTIMRSNDAWLGLPYDVFQFTQLQASMATSLGVDLGMYRHTTLSLHLYEKDAPQAADLVDTWTPQTARESHKKIWQPHGIGRHKQSFLMIQERAVRIMQNDPLEDETQSERWYRDQLHPSNVG